MNWRARNASLKASAKLLSSNLPTRSMFARAPESVPFAELTDDGSIVTVGGEDHVVAAVAGSIEPELVATTVAALTPDSHAVAIVEAAVARDGTIERLLVRLPMKAAFPKV